MAQKHFDGPHILPADTVPLRGQLFEQDTDFTTAGNMLENEIGLGRVKNEPAVRLQHPAQFTYHRRFVAELPEELNKHIKV